MIELTLPFPVSTNALTFNKPHGRAPTREYKLWQIEAGWAINQQKPQPIKGPVSLMYTFEDGRKADLGNLEKPISDLLVKHGLIEDDGPQIVKTISLMFSDQVKGVRVRVSPFAIRGAA